MPCSGPPAVARSVEQQLGFAFWAGDWTDEPAICSRHKLEKMIFLLLINNHGVASFNIVNLTMIVTEKRAKFAILKAMGATRKGHHADFLCSTASSAVQARPSACRFGICVSLWI